MSSRSNVKSRLKPLAALAVAAALLAASVLPLSSSSRASREWLAGLTSPRAAPVEAFAGASDERPSSNWSPGLISPEVRHAIARGEESIPVFVYLRPPAGHRALAPAGSETSVADLATLHAASRSELEPFLEGLEADGRLTLLDSFWLTNSVAVETDAKTLLALARRPEVERISLDDHFPAPKLEDSPIELFPHEDGRPSADDDAQWNLQQIHADEVHDLLGVTGDEITVAIIDTGVEYTHPDLGPKYRGYYGPNLYPQNAGHWWCPGAFCGSGGRYPWDNAGHGTHVLGTIIGDKTGVAPGAKWIAAMVCTAEECVDSWIIAAMEWVLEGTPERPDPADILNLSLEKSGALDYDMKRAVDALVEAGVVAVVAAGNRGQVRSPGAFTSTITVGAMDERSEIPLWSGRGVTPWFEPKPEVVAPGVGVVSTIPGGAYAANTGTSMATPHVAGVAALMLEVQRDLSPEEIKTILKRTATPLDGVVPDEASGWGVVNAYGAVASLEAIGTLRGRVLSTAGVPPRWGSSVSVRQGDGLPMGSVIPDPQGHFTMALRPGDYLVTAEAFGYGSETARASIEPNSTLQLPDFRLEPRAADAGFLVGSVRESGSGAYLDGRVLLEGTPAVKSFEAGSYAIEGIPPGTYQLRVESRGHRVAVRQVEVDAGAVTQADFELDPAPTILVVDGDAWYFSGALSYYTESLDRLGYLYDVRRFLDREHPKLPTAQELLEYDIVIWSQDFSSPGYMKASGQIAEYLAGGGRLILSGEDVACTDSGQPPCAEPWMRRAYLSDALFVEFVADVSKSDEIVGTVGSPLEGISVTLNGLDSHNNQWATDVIDVTDPLHASVAVRYADGGGAGVFVSSCVGYRAFMLGFGFEGIEGAENRDTVMQAMLSGLTAELPPAVVAHAEPDRAISLAGSHVDYTVTLHSTALQPSDLQVRAEGADWPTTIYKAGFGEPLGGTVRAASCEPVQFGVRVTIPEGTRRAVSDTVRVTIGDPTAGASDTVVLETRTAAPVLLVDGDTWVPSEDQYRNALESGGIDYDVHVVAPNPADRRSGGAPTTDTLDAYPAVIWFTGFNPHPDGHLTVETMQQLAAYLGRGGRLLFASEDHLNFRGATPFKDDRVFQREMLGVQGYIQDVGISEVSGVANTPYAGIGPCGLRPSGDSLDEFFADQLIPGPRSQGILAGTGNRVVATRYFSGTSKSAFVAFDLSKLSQSCADPIVQRTMDWFSALSASTLQADRSSYASGDTVELSIRLVNDGPRDATGVEAVWQLPSQGVPVNLPGAGWTWDAAARTLSWSGDVRIGQPVEAEVSLVLPADLPRGLPQSTSVAIYDGDGLTLERTENWRVNVADLSASDKTVTPNAPLVRGELARFTISIRNRGSISVDEVVVTDTLPSGLTLLERSITTPPGGELVDVAPHRLIWKGPVQAGGQASISYDARVSTVLGGAQRNEAVVDDGSGQVVRLWAEVLVKPNLLFPWLANKALLPTR